PSRASSSFPTTPPTAAFTLPTTLPSGPPATVSLSLLTCASLLGTGGSYPRITEASILLARIFERALRVQASVTVPARAPARAARPATVHRMRPRAAATSRSPTAHGLAAAGPAPPEARGKLELFGAEAACG